MRCEAMRCGAMRCGAMRCGAVHSAVCMQGDLPKIWIGVILLPKNKQLELMRRMSWARQWADVFPRETRGSRRARRVRCGALTLKTPARVSTKPPAAPIRNTAATFSPNATAALEIMMSGPMRRASRNGASPSVKGRKQALIIAQTCNWVRCRRHDQSGGSSRVRNNAESKGDPSERLA
jgi:hypothetical protein